VLVAQSDAQLAPPAAPGQTLWMRAQKRAHTPLTVRPPPGVGSDPPIVVSLPVVVGAGSVLGLGSFVPATSLPVPVVGSLAEGSDGVAVPAPPLPLFEQPLTAIAKASDAQTDSSVRFMTTA